MKKFVRYNAVSLYRGSFFIFSLFYRRSTVTPVSPKCTAFEGKKKKNERFHHIQKRAQSKFNQISKFHRFIECRSHHWTQNSYRTPLFTLIWPEWKGRPVYVGGITEIKDPPSWILICFSPQSFKSKFHRKTLKKCHWGFSGRRHHIKWISKMACPIWATGNSNCITI